MLGKGLEVFIYVSLGTNIRERMSVFRIFRMVVWQFMFKAFGDFELSVKCVLS